jgi:hypothetical protein
MLVFLDTEFTSFEEPYLVSAGLVANQRQFYFEVAGISPLICSSFVRKTVLPLLEGAVLKPAHIAEQLAEFLESCGSRITFVCDAPRYDVVLLEPFLPARLHWEYAVPSFPDSASELIFKTAHDNAYICGLRRHHALDDATALAQAWSAMHDRLARTIEIPY